ncbi:hypothetical protein SAMN05216198_1457 [Halopseudomonas litoralis]|uniref:Lipoprotein n=1 Tax=Halopseudomonas litoralis TaxID=797277 RepID=A0A1H1QE54_9GAMM|nr:hypothetical protein [Halopseudomonas litoralis]SDS21705.1 hypothetical protein SAMN05216198_1457 [Halopseudomonas litoralis]
MQIKTINRMLFLFIIISLMTMSGCEEPQNKKSWKIFNEALNEEKIKEVPPRNLEETIDIMLPELQSVVGICEKNAEINRVSSKDEPTSYYKNVHSSKELDAAIKLIKEKLEKVGALSVSCGRRGDYKENPLSTVSFVMHASGLSVSGHLESIVYITSWTLSLPGALTNEELGDRGFTPSKKQGWYIYKS